jgi:hypothetical protein
LKENFRAPGFSLLSLAQPAAIALPVARLARLLGKTVVLDYRVPAPEAALEHGVVEDSAAYSAARLLEDKLLSTVDMVLCATEMLREIVFERTAVTRDKLVLVPPGREPVLSGPRAKLRLTPSTRRHLVAYAGPLTAHSGADLVVRAARRIVYGLERSDIQFVLAGSGPQAEAVRDLVAAEGLQDFVTCLPGDDPALVASLLASADVAVDPTPESRLGELISSAPLLEYDMLGIPVVTYMRSEVVESGSQSVFAVPRGIPELARGILDVLDKSAPHDGAGSLFPLWSEHGEAAYVDAIQQALKLNHAAQETTAETK